MKRTYTKSEVERMLKSQRKLCSNVPLLARSRMRTDWREWNKFLNGLSKAIKDMPILIND